MASIDDYKQPKKEAHRVSKNLSIKITRGDTKMLDKECQPTYWNEDQEDITIIFFDQEEANSELEEISRIEAELQISFK